MTEHPETLTHNEADAPQTFTRWRCLRCGSVCESDEPLEAGPALEPCSDCGTLDVEGVDESVSLTNEGDEEDEFCHWRITIPDTGEIALEVPMPRGWALHIASTFAFHEVEREAPAHYLLEVSTVTSPAELLFSSARDIFRCEGCDRTVDRRAVKGGVCPCGHPFPVPAPGRLARPSGLAAQS